jgi:hypothetical protein
MTGSSMATGCDVIKHHVTSKGVPLGEVCVCAISALVGFFHRKWRHQITSGHAHIILPVTWMVSLPVTSLLVIWRYFRWGSLPVAPPQIWLCLSVIYAFAKVQGNTVQPFEWNDMPDWGKSISSHSFTNIQTNLYRGRRCRDNIGFTTTCANITYHLCPVCDVTYPFVIC